MAIVIDFTLDGKKYPNLAGGFEALSRRMALSKTEIQRIVKREITAFLKDVAKEMQAKHSTAWPSGTTDTTLSTRSGQGVKSIERSIAVTGRTLADIQGEIGGLRYLGAHENKDGTVIKPKSGQYLTIPLSAALDSRGLPKKPRARDWKNTFVNRSKSGKLLIWRRVGRRVIPLYLLVGKGETKSEIKLKPRLGMERAARSKMSKFIDNMAKSILKEGLGFQHV